MTLRQHLAPMAISATLLLTIQAPSPVAVAQRITPLDARSRLVRRPAPIVRYKTVRFVNTLPGTSARGKSVARIPFDPNIPPGNAAPAHIEFSFNHYYPALFDPQTTLPPTLAIYPISGFGKYHWDSQLKSCNRS